MGNYTINYCLYYQFELAIFDVVCRCGARLVLVRKCANCSWINSIKHHSFPWSTLSWSQRPYCITSSLYVAKKTKLFAWTMNSVIHIRGIPVKMSVYFNIVFYWHWYKPHYFATVSVHCTYMSDTIHDQFFILINVEFVTKIICMIWNWVHFPSCSCSSCLQIRWVGVCKWFTHS